MGETDPLILDIGRNIKVDENLLKYLKPHQKDGVFFMWDALFKKNHGCILAHCMGLGKTLQVVTLIHTFWTNNHTAKILILCPIIVIDNWENEFYKWMGDNQNIPIEKIPSYLSEKDIEAVKKHWRSAKVGGVYICGYEKFCNLMKDDEKPFKFEGCDVLICDEGHTLKNPDSIRNKVANEIRTQKRIILSGTPLQNNLAEYYQMMKFVKGDIWTKLFHAESEVLAFQVFGELFKTPMTDGQFLDATQDQFKRMINRSYVLHDLLKPYIHRKNGLNLSGMPEKNECVLYVCLTDVQKRLYKNFLEKIEEERGLRNLRRNTTLFRDKNVLTLICNHPKALSREDNIDVANNELIRSEQQINNNLGEWWRNCCTSDELNCSEASNKMELLFSILEECELNNEKALVFSHSLATLDVIEHFLEKKDKLRNRYYFRMDGNTKSEKRKDDLRSFLRENSTSRLYLISTTAGGVGINLISANRVIIFDLSWNPSLEVQSMYRVYRIGQQRACKIYRFVAAGTMEEKIYNRQVAKLDLADRAVDQQRIDQHFIKNDLADLYEDTSDVLPGDFTEQIHQNAFFAGQLNTNLCHRYENGDRLLDNDLDKLLSDKEKLQAYADYRQDLENF